MSTKNLCLSILLTPILASCFLGEVQLHGKEFEDAMKAIKPYGALWFKEGMTRESRREDYVACGGAGNLGYGYEIQPNQTNKEFFEKFNEHVLKVRQCMLDKKYAPAPNCDARCLHP